MIQLPYMQGAQRGGVFPVFLEAGGVVLRFPLWWYGEGLRETVVSAYRGVFRYARSIGLFVWATNILTPMFGRYDWQSRIISVFMRIMNVIVRGFMVLVYAVGSLVFCVLYVVLPILVTILALFHATSLASV